MASLIKHSIKPSFKGHQAYKKDESETFSSISMDARQISRIEITRVPERVVRDDTNGTCTSTCWWAFSRLTTLYVPDAYFEWRRRDWDRERRQAWREKVSICFVMMIFSIAFIGVGGLLPLFVCAENDVFHKTEGGITVEFNNENMMCQLLSILMYSIMMIISLVLVVQCVCSLRYVVRRKPEILPEDETSRVIVMVPCYNEGTNELQKTIDSILYTTYPSQNKVLLVVADGIVTGAREPKTTPQFIADVLGYKTDKSIGTYDCVSIGDYAHNRAKLYCGEYVKYDKRLKYIVIVKCGSSTESESTKPGNRGKRDSQLLVIGMLNRFHHQRELTDLDLAVIDALETTLSMPLATVMYLMAIDADTKVDRDSISNMIYRMKKDNNILALCGETRVDNKNESWVTWIQVYEYYTNHHMKKAFESVFGCVTCLPGCFTMYRLFKDDNTRLLSCDDVYNRYATNNIQSLHEKNLFHLGEDRMLTTLLLKSFPGMKLSFVPEAICYTIVPHSLSVLLSQRRRWINSTFHNLLELLCINNMPTVCCISMKALIALDLVATLILPASLIYIFVNIYVALVLGTALSTTTLIVLGISIGVQVLPCVLRSDLTYFGWFIIYIILGVPVFYFVLPLYSFSKMDDFSWGATRQVDDTVTVMVVNGHDAGPTDRHVVNQKTISSTDSDDEPPRQSLPATSSCLNEDEMNTVLASAFDEVGM
ncbi:hypothetical protein ACHAW6_011688 [Cyclotella cf. meneghiniana]